MRRAFDILLAVLVAPLAVVLLILLVPAFVIRAVYLYLRRP